MFAELETELIDLVRQSPLGKQVRTKSLPDTNLKDLVKRWGADAPAVYVTPLAGTVAGSIVSPRFALVLVTKNARGQEAARYGDSGTLGLYPLWDATMALIQGARTSIANWQVNRYEFLGEPVLRDSGLFAALIEVSAEADMPSSVAFESLPDFTQFNADFDLNPHSSDVRHQEWADENYSGLDQPDLQSQTGLSGPKE